MQRSTNPQARLLSASMLASLMLSAAVILAALPSQAQTATASPSKPATTTAKPRAHRLKKKLASSQPIAQTPEPPPAPQWPINDAPKPAAVVWDSSGLRINASNSSLQQILNEVSTETGTKVVGAVPDQRIFGTYGPGDARDVLSQLLLGSGYNVLLSGDLGHGAPSQVVLSPRRAAAATAPNAANRPQQDPDDEIPDQPEQPEDEPQPQVQQPPMNPETRPGFGPNGPMRTPQQVMEEMQQRQLLQQQQMQQQQNNQTPQQNPQQ